MQNSKTANAANTLKARRVLFARPGWDSIIRNAADRAGAELLIRCLWSDTHNRFSSRHWHIIVAFRSRPTCRICPLSGRNPFQSAFNEAKPSLPTLRYKKQHNISLTTGKSPLEVATTALGTSLANCEFSAGWITAVSNSCLLFRRRPILIFQIPLSVFNQKNVSIV